LSYWYSALNFRWRSAKAAASAVSGSKIVSSLGGADRRDACAGRGNDRKPGGGEGRPEIAAVIGGDRQSKDARDDLPPKRALGAAADESGTRTKAAGGLQTVLRIAEG
jgi:hypothetical protein